MTIYLYKKTHNKTGLNYLGKTVAKDPHKYQGSGTYWTNHINVHGYDVTTEILRECSSNKECKEWGIYYSNLWNVVESDEWANLKPEEGQGFATGKYNPMKDPKIKEKHRATINNPSVKQKRINTLHSEECRVKRSLTEQHPETKALRKQAQKVSQNRPEVKEKLSGPNNYRYDHTVYSFQHQSGILEYCTRRELINKYKLQTSCVSHLLSGKAKTHKGWRLLPTP